MGRIRVKASTTLLLVATCATSLVLGACGAMGPKHIEPTNASKTSRITFSTTSSVENLDVRAFYGEKKCEDFYSGYKVASLRNVSIYSEGYIQQASVTFKSGEPIIFAMGSSAFPAKPGRTLGSCYVHVQFTPATGKEYEITFSADGAGCWLAAFELSKAPDATVKKAKLDDARPARDCSGAW